MHTALSATAGDTGLRKCKGYKFEKELMFRKVDSFSQFKKNLKSLEELSENEIQATC